MFLALFTGKVCVAFVFCFYFFFFPPFHLKVCPSCRCTMDLYFQNNPLGDPQSKQMESCHVKERIKVLPYFFADGNDGT